MFRELTRSRSTLPIRPNEFEHGERNILLSRPEALLSREEWSKVQTKSNLHKFFESCSVQSDRFVATSEGTPWRLGAVLFARCANKFASVRKASVEGNKYEFSGLYTLPGGMVRSKDQSEAYSLPVHALFHQSLVDRANREAGLVAKQMVDLRPSYIGPLITRYTAKGRQRFTLVVPYICTVEEGTRLNSSDRSVDRCLWMSLPPYWNKMAPANCVALGHLVWNEISDQERVIARPHIQRSCLECSNWATSIKVKPAPPPWASDDELLAWQGSWPS